MALRQTTQVRAEEAPPLSPQVVPVDVGLIDATPSFAAPTDEAAMDPSLTASEQAANRRLRNIIILANAVAWVAIILGIRAIFF